MDKAKRERRITMDVQHPLKPEEVPEELFRLSEAYLDAAENLNSQMAMRDWKSSFQRGQVVMSIAFHAVELSLKGCLMTLDPSGNLGHHTLTKLAQRLNALIPGLDYRVPFGAVEPTSPPPPEVVERMQAHDRLAHQQNRYPADRDGRPWDLTSVFSAEMFAGKLDEIRADLRRLRDQVAKRANE